MKILANDCYSSACQCACVAALERVKVFVCKVHYWMLTPELWQGKGFFQARCNLFSKIKLKPLKSRLFCIFSSLSWLFLGYVIALWHRRTDFVSDVYTNEHKFFSVLSLVGLKDVCSVCVVWLVRCFRLSSIWGCTWL